MKNASLSSCVCLAPIPCFMDSLKDTVHKCPECDKYIGGFTQDEVAPSRMSQLY